MGFPEYRSLSRHFARGLIENDLLSPDEGLQATLAPLLAAVSAPGIILPAAWAITYGWPFATADEFLALVVRHELLLIVIPMVVVGLAAAFQWESLYPDARDRAVLGPLPVPALTLFCAKASALFLFLGLFAVASNGIMSVCYPVVANVRPQPGSPGFVATFVAHVVATFGAALFTGLVVLAAPGVLQVALPARACRAAASFVQLVTILLLVLSSLFVPLLLTAVDPSQQGRASELVSLHRLYRVEDEGTIDWLSPPPDSRFERDELGGGMRQRPGSERVEHEREVRAFPGQRLANAVAARTDSAWIELCPPVWFLGWYEVLAGRGTQTARRLAARAQAGLALAGAAVFGLYLLAYARHVRGGTFGDSPAPGLRMPIRLGRLAGRWMRAAVPSPVARACMTFSLKTLARSTRQRGVWAGALGVGLAVALADLSASLISGEAVRMRVASVAGVLSVQPVLIGLTLVGTRVAFAVPSSLPANWVFRFSGPDRVDEYASGTRRAAMVCGILLPLALLLPLHLILLGWQTAVVHGMFGLLTTLPLLELALATFDNVPCTAAYVPGRARLRTRLLPYVVAFQAWVALLVAVESWALTGPGRLAPTLGGALALYVCAVVWRRRRQRSARLVFEEPPPESVQTLGLAGPI